MARYGQAFKDRAVARLLPPESVSIGENSLQVGVAAATLERWRSPGFISARVKIVVP